MRNFIWLITGYKKNLKNNRILYTTRLKLIVFCCCFPFSHFTIIICILDDAYRLISSARVYLNPLLVSHFLIPIGCNWLTCFIWVQIKYKIIIYKINENHNQIHASRNDVCNHYKHIIIYRIYLHHFLNYSSENLIVKIF